MAVLDDPHVLDLSEEELIELIAHVPEVQAKKLMSVLIKLAMNVRILGKSLSTGS